MLLAEMSQIVVRRVATELRVIRVVNVTGS
ncbi:MAG: hypothetical protein QOI02_712, partial [Actinomycetota bacterium]|nr:hypothetical protein [Actinomycetota bacterium]